MKYSQLAEVYGDLEKTTKKLEKKDIIADLLKKTPTDKLPKIVLLLSGKIFPAWSEEKTGVASQLMIRAISKATGTDSREIVREFRKIGDLGLVAEKLVEHKKQRTLHSKTLDIDKVYDNFTKIAKQEGKSSQERKLNLIAELISHAKPNEAKYIVRTVLEELRVGVAEGIIRDAIAEAFDVDKKIVENAWFLEPDYGKIAQIAKKGDLGKVKVKFGIPLIPLLAVKSPSLEQALKDAEEPALEYKFDGMRAQIHKKGKTIIIFTRRQENVTNAFPDLVELCKNIRCDECIIEGEVLAIDAKTNRPMPFQKLSQRIKRKYDIHKMIKQIPIQVNLFDIVYLDGKLLFDKKLKERRKILEKIIKEVKGAFQLSKMLITKDLKKAQKFYEKALEAGQEGVMVKNLDAKYQPERHVGYWWKVKPTLETLDLVVIGGTWGTGKRAGWIGSYVLGCRDPDTDKFLECGMLGSGLKEKKTEKTDITMADLTKLLKPHIEKEKGKELIIKPKLVIEVAYEEIQKSPKYSSKYALRFPRVVRIRVDKGPKDADTLERIKNIYKMQKGKK